MTTQANLPIAAEIYLALDLHKAPKIRQYAATLVTRYIMELNRYGYNPGYESMIKLCNRFRLGDYREALQVHFPPR